MSQRTERSTIRKVWWTQDGVRKAYCPVDKGLVTITLPPNGPREGDRVTIEQQPDNRWSLAQPVDSGGV